MFRAIILPIFKSTRLCVTACGIMHPRCCRPVAYTTSCNTRSSALEDGQNNCPKHVELTGIINKLLLLLLVGCLYYLYQWCTVKQISDNEIYLLIKYIKSVLWRVAKRLPYIEDARAWRLIEGWVGPKTNLDILEETWTRRIYFSLSRLWKPVISAFKRKKVAGIHQEPNRFALLKQKLA